MQAEWTVIKFLPHTPSLAPEKKSLVDNFTHYYEIKHVTKSRGEWSDSNPVNF